MSKSRQKAEFRMGVGASSVLMVLVVLVLTALGLLSFSSAKNAQALTRRNLAMSVGYYQAAAKAQQKLAAMDETLAGLLQKGEALTLPAITESFQNAGLSDVVVEEEGADADFSFSVDAEYDRSLEVAGKISLQGSPRYRVTRHELISEYVGGDEYYELLGD